MSCSEGGLFAAPWPIILLDEATFPTIALPGLAAYYLSALLVTLPGTRFIRIAFFPPCIFLIYRMARLDISEGDVSRNAENMGLLTWLAIMGLRSSVWAFREKHYTRVGKKRDPSKSRTASQTLWDAGDLCFNLRGIGWDWSSTNAVILPSSLPTEPRARTLGYLRRCFINWFRNGLIFEAVYYLNLHLFSDAADIPLPPFVKLALQIMLYPISAYAIQDGLLPIYSLFGVLIFRQDPDEWPELFNAPWRSTSLTELWGLRWHQFGRDMFTNTFGIALRVPFGRAGYLLGSFAASGLYHDLGAWALQRESGMCCFLTPIFMLMGLGVLLEHLFRQNTGKRVGGAWGVIWMMLWSVGGVSLLFSPDCMQLIYQSIEVSWMMRPVHILTVMLQKVV